MSNEIVFAKGIIYKLPRNNAPDFVKGSLSFKVDEAIQFLQENAKNGWCNCNLLIAKSGNPYVSLDTWVADPNYSKGNVNVAHQNNIKKASEDKSIYEEDIPF